ncbi:hypothetical protein ABZ477_11760 [Microbacterium sp. NPDC019599]|uniref:hypothetical protein n=1 Tax=Microbacterium sp. NPDC019599 TaxID=3154690 RepID=UPI0033E2B034
MSAPAWYIDAFDPSGGIAFASCRDADADSEEREISAPSVFIASPHFDAVVVSGRALGLSATRGSFQRGVFLFQQELGFDQLDDLVEFVRRVFVGRDGDEGPAPVGERPPRPFAPFSDEDRPDDAEILDDEMDHGGEGPRRVDMLLGHFAADFQMAAHDADESSEAAPSRLVVRSAGVAADAAISADSSDVLLSGIECIARELGRRRPGDDLEWRHAVSRLAYAAFRLGLGSRFVRIDPRIWRATPGAFGELEDRYEDLTYWPIAPTTAAAIGVDPRWATVRDLLCVVTSAPMVLMDVSRADWAVVVLAAAHLQPIGLVDENAPDQGHQARVAVVEDAWSWLIAQLPDRAFPLHVEELIRRPRHERGGLVDA